MRYDSCRVVHVSVCGSEVIVRSDLRYGSRCLALRSTSPFTEGFISFVGDYLTFASPMFHALHASPPALCALGAFGNTVYKRKGVHIVRFMSGI